MFYIPQIQKDDCGFACLKMVLAHLNKDKKYLFLPQDENHGLYSFNDLIEIGQIHGLALSAFRATEKSEVSNCPRFPFIAVISLKNGSKHAVTVTKVKWKRVTYLDPRYGKCNVSLGTFVNLWDGTGLFVEDFQKKDCSIGNLEPISLGQKIGLGLIQLCVGILAVLGVYFVNDKTSIYWSLGFLSGALLLEVLLKILSYSLMKKIDQHFLYGDGCPKGNFKEFLYRFENYKKLSLSSPMNYILMLIFALGLVAVVLLNDYRNLMIICVPIVIAFLDSLIIDPIQKRKKQEIAQLEDEIDSSKGKEDFQSRCKNMHEQAYRYSYTDLLARYIYAFLMLAAVLLTMKICGISSFPYIIFYTCISLALFKAMGQLFSFQDKVQEFNIVKVKISNCLKSHE